MTYELNILNLLEQTDISREIKIVNHWMNNVVLDDLGGIRIIIRGNYAKISLVDHHNHQLFYNGELIYDYQISKLDTDYLIQSYSPNNAFGILILEEQMKCLLPDYFNKV